MSRSAGPVPEGRSTTPRWGFAVVSGGSMRPGLRSGDRVLVDYRRAPRAGDRVVARLPGRGLGVKRAAERRTTPLGEPGWWLVSDDPEHGTDSSAFGAVAETDVLGVVVIRIWPLTRGRAVPNSPGA